MQNRQRFLERKCIFGKVLRHLVGNDSIFAGFFWTVIQNTIENGNLAMELYNVVWKINVARQSNKFCMFRTVIVIEVHYFAVELDWFCSF